VAESIEQLSFELTASALSEQERALSGLRACAGTVLGAASIAGSFLRATAGSGGLDAWAILATVSFALCFATAIWVLLPHELVLALGGEELLAEADQREIRDLAGAYRAAGSWTEPRLQANRQKLDRLADLLIVSCGLLAIEVISWTISLTS
jgi:type II secretory pathway component PulL